MAGNVTAMRSSSNAAGEAASTVWPSSASNAAAASTAATTWGSVVKLPGDAVRTPMRNGAGIVATCSKYGRSGGGAVYGSPGSGPLRMSRNRAVSRTVCVTMRRATSPLHASPSGARTRDRVTA